MEIIEKPWGREKILERNDNYVLKILEVDAGKRLSLQYHEIKIETMYCLYGMGTLEMVRDGVEFSKTLMPGRWMTIKPWEQHRLCAGKNSPIAVLEASSPELYDIVRLEDDHGRCD
jgi:mannose-6-phosphate isomerase-like protein (cupin superfamily)